MARTDHTRRPLAGEPPRRQPRPSPRRQGTRSAVIAAALGEA